MSTCITILSVSVMLWAHLDQQVRNTIPPGIDSSIFALAHDDSDVRVDGQLLGYSLDAVNDFAIVSNLQLISNTSR